MSPSSNVHLMTPGEMNQAVHQAIPQLAPHLDPALLLDWLRVVLSLNPTYRVYVTEGCTAGCGVQVYTNSNPPWDRLAYEWAWWGHGKHAVACLHAAMNWARTEGATHFGYSCQDRSVMRWRAL